MTGSELRQWYSFVDRLIAGAMTSYSLHSPRTKVLGWGLRFHPTTRQSRVAGGPTQANR